MFIHSQTSASAPEVLRDASQECARIQPRHTAHSVRCNLGEVADLSIGGARILARSSLRSPVDVEFYAMNKSITLRAKVAWTRATGEGFKTEIGLVFPKLTRLQREVIESLARGNMHRAII